MNTQCHNKKYQFAKYCLSHQTRLNAISNNSIREIRFDTTNYAHTIYVNSMLIAVLYENIENNRND